MKRPGKIPPHIVDRAYDMLSDWDKMLIEHQVRKLTGIHNVGTVVAKEIIAHIGLLMEEKS